MIVSTAASHQDKHRFKPWFDGKEEIYFSGSHKTSQGKGWVRFILYMALQWVRHGRLSMRYVWFAVVVLYTTPPEVPHFTITTNSCHGEKTSGNMILVQIGFVFSLRSSKIDAPVQSQSATSILKQTIFLMRVITCDFCSNFLRVLPVKIV